MQKTIYVESINSEVIIARRKGTRSMRLSIRSDGRVRISIPYGISEKLATKFLQDKSEWIKKHKKPDILLNDGDRIGKSHRISFVVYSETSIKTRLNNNQIIIKVPETIDIHSLEVQSRAMKVAEKALRIESSHLLPQRLKTLGIMHGIGYSSCEVKKLKSRWGSCDSKNNIILNIYLIQLDWHLIDYVLLHELAHTKHKHHQSQFWEFMNEILPDYKDRRKLLKQKSTVIMPN